MTDQPKSEKRPTVWPKAARKDRFWYFVYGITVPIELIIRFWIYPTRRKILMWLERRRDA